MANGNRRHHPANMQTHPNPIDFGVTLPGGMSTALFNITNARSDARLTATVVDGDSGHRFSIISLTSYTLTRVPVSDTGEVPHGVSEYVDEWDEADSTDGSRPLRVSGGDNVEILLRFDSLQPGAQGRFTATLVIQDASLHTPWAPISAQMIAQVARVSSILPDAVQLIRGQTTSVPLTVISDAAPDTTVSYSLGPRQDGISMTPLQVSLAHDGRVDAHLEFTAAANAQLGTRDVTIYSSTFNGQLTGFLDVPVTVLAPLRSPEEICQTSTSLSAPWAQDKQIWTNFGIIDSAETFLGYLPAPRLFRPTNPYEVSFAITEAEMAQKRIRALGSGWSFSDAVLPQTTPIAGLEQIVTSAFEAAAKQGKVDEPTQRWIAQLLSNHFGYAIDTTTLDRSLQTLLPDILADNQHIEGLFFVEAGMTIYDLNILLDSQTDKARLALKTMGGASAQTIAGTISTGTHGGDFDRPPVADNVRAIYLIGKGGVHHWIEPANPITERGKIRAAFPCIADQNIHYDDDMFRAALVSMGAMGVIYAVILDVVPQYWLLQFNKWTKWKDFKKAVEADSATVFSGEYSGLKKYLSEQFPRDPPRRNRFLQVVINPMKDGAGEHTCFVTNRVELDIGPRSGVTPLGYGEVLAHFDWVANAIKNSPEANFFDEFILAVHDALGDFEPKSDVFALARKLIQYCKDRDLPWIVRTIIDLVMQKSFPSSGEWTSVWDTMGGEWTVTPVVGTNPSGGLSVFMVGKDLHNLFRYDQNGPSGPWTLLPISMGGDWSHDQPPVVVRNHAGGLSVFLVGKDNVLYRYDQDGMGGWTPDPTPMIPPAGSDWSHDQPPVVAPNPTGGLSVFLVGDNLHTLRRCDQDGTSRTWSWSDMGGDWSHDQPPVAAYNLDGLLSVFLVGKDDVLYRFDQDAPTSWRPAATPMMAPMGSHWTRDQPPVVALNPRGGLNVFLVGDDDVLYRYEQDGMGVWNPPAPIPMIPPTGSDWSHDQPPVVAPNPTGGLSLFLVGDNLHTLRRCDQNGASGIWSWSDMGGDWSRKQPPVVVRNHSGGLSVFLVGKDLHNLFRYDQDRPTGAWTAAMSMGGDWSQDHPVVIGGTPYVGMSVFLVAKDERGFGGPVLGGIVGALTSGLTLEFLGVVGDLAGLAGLAGTAAGILGKYLDDAAAGRPVLCRYDLSSPQIDVGYKVMAPAPSRPVRGFPILGGTAIEAAFSFSPTAPTPNPPATRVPVPDAITFVQAVLDQCDAEVDSADKVFPAGWISLRVTGRTDALLGMQQFDATGMIEVVLIGNADDYGAVQELEKIAIAQGGVLHWGQSNGLLTAQDVASRFPFTLARWSAAQRALGDDTFRNHFMDRCGL